MSTQSAHEYGTENRAGLTTLQKVTAAFGVVFLLVGVLGFVPGVTTSYGALQFAGHDSGAMLLGLFMVSVLHNIVHLLFGVAGLVASRRWASSRAYLLVGGAVYLLLWVYGLVIDQQSAANVVPVNTADNWLHFGLGVAMVALGSLLSRRSSTVRPT